MFLGAFELSKFLYALQILFLEVDEPDSCVADMKQRSFYVDNSVSSINGSDDAVSVVLGTENLLESIWLNFMKIDSVLSTISVDASSKAQHIGWTISDVTSYTLMLRWRVTRCPHEHIVSL